MKNWDWSDNCFIVKLKVNKSKKKIWKNDSDLIIAL